MRYNLTRSLRVAVYVLLAAFSLTISNKSFAQTPANESQLKKEAAKYFENEDYVNAYPLYSQLLSLYPQDPNYNYRFGACMLYSQADKQKPLDYFEHAVLGSGVDIEAFYYIGVAYHLNYRFDDAIREFNYFKQRASSSQLKKHPVDRLIEMCNNGKSLLKNLHDLDVLRKEELRMSDYYEAYDLNSNGGNLLVEPDDFKTKTDKKKNLTSIIYLSPDKTLLFFASYGDDDKNGKDIYMARHLPNGSWGPPSNLGSVINTPYDEDYPFYDAPTHTLYFCSKGHNSMGGYDVFRSTYNDEANTWSQPINMDFPINTPGDDILFVADTLNQTAFFSSTRSSPDGKIAVYKILIQPHPPDSVFLNGIAYGDDKRTPVSSRITVKNGQNNEVIGIFSSAADNGAYTMSLVNGGSFVFTVETPNHKTQSQAIAIPSENELAPLRQRISYEPSTDKLIIDNLFGGAAGDSSYLAAMDYIQKKALMNVNVDTTVPIKKLITAIAASNNNQQQNNTQSQQNQNNATNNNVAINNNTNNTTQSQQNSTNSTNTANNQNNGNNNVAANTNQNNITPPDTAADTNESAIVDTSGKSNVSNQQLEQIASKDAKQQQQQAQAMKDETNKAIEYANSKMQEAQQLAKQAQETTERANNITDPKQKQDSLDKAASLTQQSQQVSKKAVEAFQMASQTQSQATAKQQEADQATQYAAELDSALKYPNHDKAITKLQRQRDSLEKQVENNPPAMATAGDMIRTQARDTKQDSVEVAKHNEELKKAIDRLQQESEDYVAQAQKTDNAQEKVALLNQAKDLDDSKKNKEKEIKDNDNLMVDLHNQYTDLLTQAKQADSLTRNTSMNTQVASADRDSLKHDIENYTPANNVVKDTAHKAVAINNNATNNQSQENNNTSNNTSSTVAVNNNQNNANTTNNTNSTNNQSQENNNATNSTQNNTNTTVTTNTNPNNNQSQENNNTANSTQNNTNTTVANNTNSTNNQSQANNNSANNNQNNATNNNIAVNNNVAHPDTTNKTAIVNNTSNNTQNNANNNVAVNNNVAHPDTTNKATTANNNTSNNTQTNTNNNIVVNNNVIHPDTTNKTATVNNNTVNNTQTNANNNVVHPDTTSATSNPQNNNVATNTNTPPVITYSNNTASQSNRAASTYTSEAAIISAQADDVRKQAQQTSDPAQAKALYHKADSLDNIANERKATADIYENDANKNQYNTNRQQLSVWKNTMQNNPSNLATTAQLLIEDATLYYKQAVIEKQKADSSSDPYTKQTHLDKYKQDLETAVAKQQKAQSIYLQLNPQLANVTIPANTLPDTTSNKGQQVAANNNVNNNTAINTNATNNQTQNTTSNNTQNNSSNNVATNTNTNNNTQNNSSNNVAANTNTNNNTQNNANTSVAANTNPNNSQTQENNNTAANNTQNNANNNVAANTNPNNNQTQENNNTATNNTQNNANNNVAANTTQNNNQTQENNNTATNSNQNNANNNVAANTSQNNNQTQENNNIAANNTQNSTNTNVATTNNANTTQTQENNNNAVNNTQNNTNNNTTTNNTSNNTNPNRTITTTQYGSNIHSANSPDSNAATTNTNMHNNTTVALTVDVFQETATSPYTANHPIPVNPPLPEGLVYKIQVGAFRNPIPQNLFKGLQPIMAETTPQGFKRYTVGLFKEFPGAQTALTKVHGLGYKDAFIVAFYNGKRVPINSIGAQTIANNTEPANNNTNTQTTANNNNTSVAPSTSVTDVKGLFYTVQVGAYINPVPSSKLSNLSPLFSYRAANGYLRYNCGIYSSVPKANSAKDVIVATTNIKDAFVVVYYNGERISIPQATQLLNSGSATISKDANMDVMPKGGNGNATVPINNTPANNTPVNNTPANNTTTPVNNTTANTTPTNTAPAIATTPNDTSKVVFSVQIGAYSGEIPISVANNILKIASQGIHIHKDESGISIYTVGEYPNYSNASLFKDELVQDGFPGCFVVAYYKGKKISLQQAQSLMNQ